MSAPDSPPRLTVFFQAYNDSGTIASMVVGADLAAGRLTPDFEVILINDGSRDVPPPIVDELARVYPQVCAVHHQVNGGYGGALRSGLAAATKQWIFCTDGDAQYDPSEMAELWAKHSPGVELIGPAHYAGGHRVPRRARLGASRRAALRRAGLTA